MKRITINVFSGAGIDEALNEIELRKQHIQSKVKELCERCASLGATVASLRFARAIYTGKKDINIHVEEIPNGYVVKADGESVLFLEFGSGIRFSSDVHPESGEYGMGVGTYPIPPGKGHWDNPKGWYLPKDKGGGHTYGNPPARAMYEARKEIEQNLKSIVQAVFGND